MTKKELLEHIKDVPDDAEVRVFEFWKVTPVPISAKHVVYEEETKRVPDLSPDAQHMLNGHTTTDTFVGTGVWTGRERYKVLKARVLHFFKTGK